MNLSKLLLGSPLLLAPSVALAQSVVLVGPNEGNFAPVDTVVLDDNGTTVVQTSSQPNGTLFQRSTPVNLQSIGLQNGDTLDIFNFGGLDLTLENLGDFQPAGIGVLESDGTQTLLNDSNGTAAFENAAEGALQNANLNSYIFYDGISQDPQAGTADYRIDFRFAFESTDYLVVQERNGNTFFDLTALDINGVPIEGANVLRFGENGGPALSVFDFNTGFANANFQSAQSFAFTVAEISEFFEGTGIEEVPIFGFEVDNDGEADVKFFGASDDTFLNNPVNQDIPGVAAIPEPSVSVLMASLALFAFRRKRA